jgi:RNA polymerase sigma-54 factor
MKLELGLKQTLKVSLNLQQTINMLQLGSLDIQQIIKQEIESNPFLIDDARDNESSNESVDDGYLDDEDFLPSAADYDASYKDLNLSLNNVKVRYNSEDLDPISNITKETSLKEHVLQQIYTIIHDHKERIIAYHLIDMLTDSGYIEGDLEELRRELKCSNKLLFKTLSKLQTLEPSGIFARDLAECLKIQLQEQNILNKYYEILLDNLPRIAMKDYLALARLCKRDESEIRNMVNVIKSLNPKPGSSFSSHKAIIKIADVFVHIDNEGNLLVELNKDNSPRIKVAKEYYNEVKPKVKNQEQRKFLSERYQSAGMLLSSLEQRNNAIIKVAESLVRFQRNFFEKGILHLKPLTLHDIAQDISMSESTVSRVTANKYIACPSGIFEMKYFFSGGIQTKSSADTTVSSTKVKEIIKKLVELEDRQKVISDEELAQELSKFNIKIARRTVAKYREQLKIPTAFVRRREKADA